MANEKRLSEVIDIFARVCSQYLDYSLGHLRIGTTSVDTGKRDVEDLIAIPDLAAGALCSFFTESKQSGISPTPGLVLPSPTTLPVKTRTLTAWLQDSNQPLKRLVYLIDDETNSSRLILKRMQFIKEPLWITTA